MEKKKIPGSRKLENTGLNMVFFSDTYFRAFDVPMCFVILLTEE